MKIYNSSSPTGKVHKVAEPFGYPIRLCSGTIDDTVKPTDMPVNCKRCLAKLNGKERNFAAGKRTISNLA